MAAPSNQSICIYHALFLCLFFLTASKNEFLLSHSNGRAGALGEPKRIEKPREIEIDQWKRGKENLQKDFFPALCYPLLDLRAKGRGLVNFAGIVPRNATARADESAAKFDFNTRSAAVFVFFRKCRGDVWGCGWGLVILTMLGIFSETEIVFAPLKT